MEHTARRARHSTWMLTLATSVVATVALGCAGADSDESVAADDDSTRTSAATDQSCGEGTFVYLDPGVTSDQIDAVRAALIAKGLTPDEFLDEEATYADFLRLFADEPDFIEGVEPDELPQSFRISTHFDPDVIVSL